MTIPIPRGLANIVRSGIAGGLVAAALPLAASPAAPAAAAAEYGGFATEAWATPLRIELYEPSIPIPAEPQGEVFLGYSKVKADSGLSEGKASYLWPGDPVGDGLATFGSELGLPEQLTQDGYPVQVNSKHPSDNPSQEDEPLPGMVMETSSEDAAATASTGFSPDGVVLGPDEGDEETDEEAGTDDPLGGLGALVQDLPEALKNLGGAGAEEEAGGVPGLPAPLALLVDMDGYVSTSRTTAQDGPVVAASRAALGEIRLLGGLITLGGVEARAKARTDGETGTARGGATWGGLTIAGKEFSIGPDGAIVASEPSPLPLLDQLPGDALEALGITFVIPEPTRTIEGDKALSVSEGLKVIIDTEFLSPVLQGLPSAQLGELIPAEAGPLKGVVGGLSTLAPRIVITLGTATATVDTVPPVDIPPPPEVDAPAAPAQDAPAADAPAAEAPGAGTTAAAPQPAPAPEPLPAVAPSTEIAPASSNLPPLFSIPGMLLLAALALGAVVGNWFRIMGAKALGGGAACAHGLDSGVPDLRKA